MVTIHGTFSPARWPGHVIWITPGGLFAWRAQSACAGPPARAVHRLADLNAWTVVWDFVRLNENATPLVVMTVIPFSLVGVLPAHWALGAFFTATSMIGFIAGAGIVVRNSIILVDFIELRLREGAHSPRSDPV